MTLPPEILNQQHFIEQYGSFAIFALLALGIVGLPIPDETLLVLTGFLVAKGRLPLFPTFFFALFGSMTGITVSYLLGFFVGKPLLLRYGKYLYITREKLEKAHNFFERVGKWSLTVGYFIPGLRHLTGFLAGASYLEYWRFALFAYLGSILWCSTFFSVGYFSFGGWQDFYNFWLS